MSICRSRHHSKHYTWMDHQLSELDRYLGCTCPYPKRDVRYINGDNSIDIVKYSQGMVDQNKYDRKVNNAEYYPPKDSPNKKRSTKRLR
jgi:hypothetical protein